MKGIRYIVILCALAFAAVSCAKFLDVNPKGEVFDADMFTSGEGFEDALYGVYNEIATSESLYEANLHWLPEACSQNVSCIGDYKFGNLSLGDWYSRGPVDVREKIWADAYTAINHINNIIMHADEVGEDAFRHSALYKGEALALRALLHFELIRIFGAPVWASESERAVGIPYVENYSFDITLFSSCSEVYDKIIRDLKEAERLLSEDEVLVPEVRDNSATGFTGARITHLNLYAVQALLARVYWSLNDLPNAAAYALKVIDSGKFSFRPQSAFVQPDNGTLDLNETIFGLYSRDFQTRNMARYRLNGSSSLQSFLLADDWKTLFESSGAGTDYRVNAWFNDSDQTLTKLVNRTFYADASPSYTGRSILGDNILRLPEMYYIMAEFYLSTDPSEAGKWYDQVVVTRGLEPLAESGTMLTYEMLFNERRREFYGEGFTWHEMKRTGRSITTSSGAVLPGNQISTYTIPVPDKEWEARNNVQ